MFDVCTHIGILCPSMVCSTAYTCTHESLCLIEGVSCRESPDESITPPAFHVYTRDRAPEELIGTFDIAKLSDGVVHLMLQARMSHCRWLSRYVKRKLSGTNTRYHVLTSTEFE